MLKLLLMISLASIIWWRNNIIMMLLSMELMILTILTLTLSNSSSTNLFNIFLMISLMVASSSIGLSFLVMESQSHNSSNSIFIWTLTYDKNINTRSPLNLLK